MAVSNGPTATTHEPLDMATISGSLRKTMRLAVAHDAHRTLGFGAEIAARCMEEAFDYLDAPIRRLASIASSSVKCVGCLRSRKASITSTSSPSSSSHEPSGMRLQSVR